MKRKIRKVAVLGAGVMGAGISAHLANAGIPSILLDIVPPNLPPEAKGDRKQRNAFAKGGVDKAASSRPALFYTTERVDMIEIGNFEDDLHRVAECDLIIEVVKEDMDVKRTLFKKVLQHWKPGTIVASNTSGLAITAMTEGFPKEWCENFIVTHFFNPVRYMKLLELVVGPDTLPEVTEAIADFGENVLGKGIVYGKDTPNFVANRIGVHGVMAALKFMSDLDLTPEQVDAIAGTAMGRPKSAVFRTIDMVGLDTFVHVALNVFENCPNDEDRPLFNPPAWVHQMVEKKILGDKVGGGFYRKEKKDGKKDIFALNPKTLEYAPATKPKFEAVDAIKKENDLKIKLGKLVYGEDVASKFAWKSLAASLVYSANRLFEIADDVVNIDRGMKWGFNWEMGPFEAWDAIGVAKSVAKMEAEGIKVPARVKEMLVKSEGSFYKEVNGETWYWDFKEGTYKPNPGRKTWLKLDTFRKRGSALKTNDSATLHDLGDGALGLEFHSKMNAIDDGIVNLMNESLDILEDRYETLVVYNEGSTGFSVGANLMLIGMYAGQKKYSEIERIVDAFQQVNTRMHRVSRPVVVAPHGLVLGGGCEVCLGGSHVMPAAETYIGLVEVGVGLIPGGGGTKEMMVRWMNTIPRGLNDRSVLPYLQKVFEIIGMAKVAVSAMEGFEHLFFRPGQDRMAISRDNQLYQAKEWGLGLARSGYVPAPPVKFRAAGTEGIALLEAGLYTFGLSGWVTEYDKYIGLKLAKVLSGGEVAPGTLVSEDRILELEKEVFMSLVGEPRSQDRIRHMLINNKPLRN